MAQFDAMGVPPAAGVGAVALRASTDARVATRPAGPEMHDVVDVAVPPLGLPARLHRPACAAAADRIAADVGRALG